MCVARLHACEDCSKCLPHNTCVWQICRFFWRSLRYTHILIHHFTNLSDDRVSAANLVSDLYRNLQTTSHSVHPQGTATGMQPSFDHTHIIILYTQSPPSTHPPPHTHTHTHSILKTTMQAQNLTVHPLL